MNAFKLKVKILEGDGYSATIVSTECGAIISEESSSFYGGQEGIAVENILDELQKLGVIEIEKEIQKYPLG